MSDTWKSKDPIAHKKDGSFLQFEEAQTRKEQLVSDINILMESLGEKDLEQLKIQMMSRASEGLLPPLKPGDIKSLASTPSSSRNFFNRDLMEKRLLPMSDIPGHQMSKYIAQLEYQLRKEKVARNIAEKELIRFKRLQH